MCVYYKQQYSKESIQQLVIDAETLVREDIFNKTPTHSQNSFSENSPVTIRKKSAGEKVMATTHPKIKRVQEWLHQQSTTVVLGANVPPPPLLPVVSTDCEASGEYTGKII